MLLAAYRIVQRMLSTGELYFSIIHRIGRKRVNRYKDL